MKRTLRTFALLCAAFSCASALMAAKPPKWVMGQDPAYPDTKFVTGVGVGNDLDAARENARAEISKVFQARIEQTATDKQTEASASAGKKRGKALGTQESETKTKVSTESLLEGVVIAQNWHDGKAKKYYALAVLDKAKTRQALSTQITEKEEGIGIQMTQANASATPIEKARSLAQALRLAKERDELATRRRVVDPAAIPELSIGSSTPELQRNMDETLGKIQFIVEAQGGEGSHLKETVTGKVNEMGFKVLGAAGAAASTPENPVLKITCALALEPFDRGNPQWKFFMWKGTFEMSEAGGKVLASSAPSGSDGHILEAAARTKTLASGEEALAQEAQDQINKYIFGD